MSRRNEWLALGGIVLVALVALGYISLPALRPFFVAAPSTMHTETFSFQGFSWALTNVGQEQQSASTTITNSLSVSTDSISIHQEANTNSKASSEMQLTLNDLNLREKDKLTLFATHNGNAAVNGGGGMVVYIKDEIGQEVEVATGSKGCGTASGCSWSFGATELTISSDKTQVIGKVEGGISKITSTAHLGSTWTLHIRLYAAGSDWGGASQSTSINFIEALPPTEEAPTISTPAGGQQEVISPTAEEERIEETALPVTPAELAAEGLGISTIAGIIILIVIAGLLLRRRR